MTRLTVQRGAALLGMPAAVLMLPDEDGVLRVRAAHGISEDLVARFSVPLSDEIVGQLQGLFGVPEDCVTAVPLIVAGEVTGLVAVASDRSTSAADEWLLSAVADHAAVALENARYGGVARMAMEERLRASEGATSAKDRALKTLAHDIRTPLGAIEGYCGILEAEVYGDINERQRETIGRVRMSGRHLLSLLENVMDMARLDAGVLTVDTEPTRMVDVAREAFQLVIPAAEARLHDFTMTVVADVVVTADPERLRQVIVNLLGNAVKFTPEGGEITLSTHACVVGGGGGGEVRIHDSGPGIASEEQAVIFEPYYRSEAVGQTPGVGLGLAISHALITQMGGELAVESAPGTGTTFIVRLPGVD